MIQSSVILHYKYGDTIQKSVLCDFQNLNPTIINLHLIKLYTEPLNHCKILSNMVK